jgi:hypothetical protein
VCAFPNTPLAILHKSFTFIYHKDVNVHIDITGSPRFAPVQFAPIPNNADFETRSSKIEKKYIYILLLFITFYNFSRTASYTKS